MRSGIFIIFTFILFACELNDEEAPGSLVPPTAAEDPGLPQLTITVSGKERAVHLQTFGNPDNPPILMLPVGPGADFRFFLPFKALGDSFYVVMWDSPGAGLSERVTKEELSIGSFMEEVAQVKAALALNGQLILVGHSFGANVLLKYTALHPEEVTKLILIEPGTIDLSAKISHNGGAVGFVDGQDFFWQNEILTSKDHASADYKGIEILPKSSRNWSCNGEIIENYPLWRFGAYHYYVVQMNMGKLDKDFNWASGIEKFKGPISLIAGACGALGAEFQRNHNLPALPGAELEVIAGAGHISLFTDYSNLTIKAVRKRIN